MPMLFESQYLDSHPDRLDGLKEIARYMGMSEGVLRQRSKILQEQGILLSRYIRDKKGDNHKIIYAYKDTLRDYLSRLEVYKHKKRKELMAGEG